MPKNETITAIGLMSGTSLDGIDVSLIKSDGHEIYQKKQNLYYEYDNKTRVKIKKLIENKLHSLEEIKQAELLITEKHIAAVELFLQKFNLKNNQIDIIGFHGQTILHQPEAQITWQIGNSQMLATRLKIDVVADFRTKDVINGGQGAPLVPIYHHALFKNYINKPIIILNIGGVCNITYLPRGNKPENMVACDTCFGNAPIDDLVFNCIGRKFDEDGKIAQTGKVNHDIAQEILQDPYFIKSAPKSLDRNHFQKILTEKLQNQKLQDALATICYIIGQSLNIEIKKLAEKPEEIIICGGGRKNQTIIKQIIDTCQIKVIDINDINELDGDFIESQTFAFLAIRYLKNLPITFSKTTGIKNNYDKMGVLFQK